MGGADTAGVGESDIIADKLTGSTLTGSLGGGKSGCSNSSGLGE